MIPRVCAAVMLALILFRAGMPTAQAPPVSRDQPQALRQGQPIARDLAPGESHSYGLTLASGDFLHITIRQQGIDVAATLLGPDGREALNVNAEADPFREEIVTIIADTPGSYTLHLAPAVATRPPGRYVIVVDDRRPATPGDRVRIEAERAFERGESLYRSGETSGRSALYVEAFDQLDAAVRRFREIRDRRGEMKALASFAAAGWQLSRPDVLAYCEQAERIARELGDEATLSVSLHCKAIALERLGEMTAALQAYEESISIDHALGNTRHEALALNSEGINYGRRGDSETAIGLFERASSLARSIDDLPIQLFALNNLGVAYKNVGEYEKALIVYTEALARHRERKDLAAQAMVLNNIGNLQHLLGNDRQALDVHQEALALSREIGGKENEARSLNTIGETYYAIGEYAKAIEYHGESLSIRRQIGDLAGQGASLDGEGRAWQRLGETEKALTALRESLATRRNIREHLGEVATLRDLAVVERDRGDLDAAIVDIRAAVDLEEALRERITSPQLRTAFVATQQDKFELFIDLLEQQHLHDPSGGQAAAAFQVSERARARVLLESLLDANVDLRQGIEPGLLERERALQKQLNDASTRLSRSLTTSGRGGAPDAEVAETVERLTAEYQQLEAQIRRQSPRYADLTQPQPLTAAEIQKTVLDDDTVLLEFALGDEKSWLWSVTPKTITSVELAPRRQIDAAARSLYEGLTARQRRHGETAGTYAKRVAAADARLPKDAALVSEMLLGGVSDRLQLEWKGKRLAIVPTGSLEYRPFAALPVPDLKTTPPRAVVTQGRPVLLGAAHEIVNIPSASVLAALRRQTGGRRPAPQSVAILADPVFDAADPRVRFSRTTTAASIVPESVNLGRRDPLSTRAELGRLPFSRQEAEAIASMTKSSRVYKAIDFNASRAAALDDRLADYRIVHFATHGVLDSARPSVSGLILSLVDEHGTPRNGYLHLQDIYNMRLGADLVVLSACQTALGKEIKGEGLVGLTRGFMYAGAPRIVASLWQVSDLATADLMKKFYNAMFQRGLPAAAALRTAQLEMSKVPRWASPYYWAGFVLQGDWR